MFITAVSVETQITGKVRASLDSREDPSGLARFVLDTLKPRFEIETEFGAYNLSPYGEPDPRVRTAILILMSLFAFLIIKKCCK